MLCMFVAALAVEAVDSAAAVANKPEGVATKWWLGKDCGGCKNLACEPGDTCLLDDGGRACAPTDALTDCSCQPDRSGGMELRALGFCVNHEGKEPARSAILIEHSYLQCKNWCDSRVDCTGISFKGGDCYVYTSFPITPPHLLVSDSAECYVTSMLNSVDWPVLPITRRHYIGCFRDNSNYGGLINPLSDAAGVPIARSGLKINARFCAWHCTSNRRTHFALRVVRHRRGKHINLCLCGDGYRDDGSKFERVGDINCMPACDGESGPCGGSSFNALYAIPVPADGADCPNGHGQRQESSYIYLQGMPPSGYPQVVDDTQQSSCHHCAMACTNAPLVQSMSCHAYSCDYSVETKNYRCRLFSLPIPTSTMGHGTGGQHLCVLRTCLMETRCHDGYQRVKGFAYLSDALGSSSIPGQNSTTPQTNKCAACALQCTDNTSCVAYQCSNTLNYCHIFASRAVNSTITVSNVVFCARIPDENCDWPYGTLATATDCRCGQNGEICLAGTRCKIDGISQIGTCLPTTPSCTTDANCPCHMGTCAANNRCVNCDDPGCPSAMYAVCGADNTTYDNACYASCNQTSVVHNGTCGQVAPYPNCTDDLVSSGLVCGSDGKTYLHKCALIASLGSLIGAAKGECKRQCTSGETECTCGTEYCSNGANGTTVCTDLSSNNGTSTSCKPPCDSISSTACACNINGTFTECRTGTFCVIDALGHGSCGAECDSCDFASSLCACEDNELCASGEWCEDGQCVPRCEKGNPQDKCRCGSSAGSTCGVRAIDGQNMHTLCPSVETEGRSSNNTCMPACTGEWAINCICVEGGRRELANAYEAGGPYVCINGTSREKVCSAENLSNCRCGKHMVLCGNTADNVRTYCNATRTTDIGACVAECSNYDSAGAYPNNCACPSSTDATTNTVDFCEEHTYCDATSPNKFACTPGCENRFGEAANDDACICAAGVQCGQNKPFCLNPLTNSTSINTDRRCRKAAVRACTAQDGSAPSSKNFCLCGGEAICGAKQTCVGGTVKQCLDSTIKNCPNSCVAEPCKCDNDLCPVGYLCVQMGKTRRACTPPIKRCKANNLENCLCGPSDKSVICPSSSRCTEPGPRGTCQPIPSPWWEKPHKEHCAATELVTPLSFSSRKKHSHLLGE